MQNRKRKKHSLLGLTLSGVELSTLTALIAISNGNVYAVWKESGLKYYSTVLRTLKKLLKKDLAYILDRKGERGEGLYATTFLGTLVPVLINQNRTKLFALMADASTRFNELVNSKIEEGILYDWAIDAFHELLGKSRKADSRSLNRALEDAVSDTLGGITVDILNERNNKKTLSEILSMLKQFATIRWVKDLIIPILDDMLNDAKKDQQNLEMFKQELGD